MKSNKITRFPYWDMIGESLTQAILRHRKQGKTQNQTVYAIWRKKGIQSYVARCPEMHEKLYNNIVKSVGARFSEEKSRGR